MAKKDDFTKKLSDKTEFFAVDFFRVVFALGVVAIHLGPLEDVNYTLHYFLTNVPARLGVPFFFLVSGFFLQKKLDDAGKIKAYVLRLLQLYFVYTLLYLPQMIHRYVNNDQPFVHDILVFTKRFFFTGSYLQLWYFVALVVATLLLYLLVKKLGLSDGQMTAVVLALYAAGTIGNAYIMPLIESVNVPFGELAGLNERYILLWAYYKVFDTTRNGLFFGLPFLFFGYLIAGNKEKIHRKNYFLLSVLSFAAMTGEAWVVHKIFGGDGSDMLIMMLPTAVLVFLFVLFIDCDNNERSARRAKHFRYLSVLYFGLHPLMHLCVDGLLKTGFGIEPHSLVRFVLVVLLNSVVAEIVIRLSDRKYFRWLKKLY